MSPILLRMLVILIGVATLFSMATPEPNQIPVEIPQNLTKDPLTASDQAKIAGLTKVSEWLGPLAPIAISPFFGITMLSGLSVYGGESLPFNSFISNNPVLGNPVVFWVFLGLTIVTSLPRFTKVSKPAAQAIDQLEAYAGIITIVVIRLLTMIPAADPDPQTAVLIEMGVLSFTSDVLLSVAAVINIVVINTVKFFFEVMVWLIPIPFVDAMLEVANKSACAGLMAIYAWSPTAATILNLVIFVVCLFAFRWIHRQVVYFRSLLFDPVWAMIVKSYGVPVRSELVVFPQIRLGPFPAKSKLVMRSNDSGWTLTQDRLFLPHRHMELSNENTTLEIQPGMLINSITMSGAESSKLLFSRRYSDHLPELGELMKIGVGSAGEVVSAKAEFA